MKIVAFAFISMLVACGSGASKPPVISEPQPTSATPSPPPAESAAPAASTAPAAPVTPSADPKVLLARMRGDLTACFENGRKAAPEMTDGKLVLNVGVAPSGKPACVVATDTNGVTREVEECMSARAERELYPSGPGYSIAIPLVVQGGKVDLAGDAKAPAIEKIEAEGVSGAGVVIQGMMNDLRACMRAGISKNPSMKGVLYLNAKIGKKGEVVCAVATRADAVPADVRACAVERISKAKFSAPKWGTASLSVPLKVVPAMD